MSHRMIARFTACAALLGAIAWTRDAGWNTSRAMVVAGTTTTPAQITLVGGAAIRDDITLRDGTIEADIDPPGPGQFAGLAFHMANAADYELVYFAGANGQWQEVQYQGLFQGEPTWQLYPGEGYLGELAPDLVPAGKPMHVKIVFAGTRADVYINRAAQPVLRIPELKHTLKTGHVGVWTKGADGLARMSFNNFTATSHVGAPLAAIPAATAPAGQIMRWRVSARLRSPGEIEAPKELTAEHTAALRDAKTAKAESDGLMNLSRIVGNPAGPQVENVPGGAGWGLALATTTIDAASAHTAQLHFGYSDGIAIFLNGERVFSGTHPYATPDIGRIIGQPNVVSLPLRSGPNELVLAVTDKAFGWGFRAQLTDDVR